jgi:uncharacterized protein (DUF58 family)
LRLLNTSRLGKLWVDVHDLSTLPDHHASLVTALGGRRGRQWTITTRLRRRGRFLLGPVRLGAGDPFGLFPTQQALRGTVELLVYPAAVPLPNVSLVGGELPGGSMTHRRTPHVTPNVSGIREYAPSDSLNRIAWSATARLGRLMVKEFELDPTADVWLVLDMERWVHLPVDLADPAEPGDERADAWRESTEEFCVTVAASLGQHFLDQKRSVGLLMAGQHYEVIPADRGPRQLMKLLEALAVVRAEGGRPLGEVLTAEAARFTRHSAVIVITPSTDEVWVPALATIMQGGARATAVVVEASTFGGGDSPLLVVSQLTALRVPTFTLKRHDDLATVLGQPK